MQRTLLYFQRVQEHNGLPSTSGFRTRVDGSIFQGCKITPYYDSLIAKVNCKGRNRTEAIQRTLRSLDEFVLKALQLLLIYIKKS